MNELIKAIAEYAIAIPVLLTAWLFFKQKQHERLQFIGFVFVGGLLSLALAKLASKLYVDPRPFVTDGIVPLISHHADNGFPSDHALLAFFIAFALMRINKLWGVIGFTLALLIGTARVAAGVHHAKDIVGSLFCAGIGSLIALLILKYANGRRVSHGTGQQSGVQKSV